MSAAVLVLTSFGVTLVGSELVLQGTKLQTGLARVILVWGGVYLAAAYLLWTGAALSLFAFTIFWGGAFLSWFGIRSHIESSILLRMLVMLRRRDLTESQLVAEYTARHGEAARIEELCRGGLAQQLGGVGTPRITPKGERILGVVAKLR